MRAIRFLLPCLCLIGLTAFDSPRTLTVPTQGDPSQRVLALWGDTRPIVIADAGERLSDPESVARGAPLIAAWTQLQTAIASSDAAGEAHAVLKLLNDLYGREQSAPGRRIAVRNQTRVDFGNRLANIESRLNR